MRACRDPQPIPSEYLGNPPRLARGCRVRGQSCRNMTCLTIFVRASGSSASDARIGGASRRDTGAPLAASHIWRSGDNVLRGAIARSGECVHCAANSHVLVVSGSQQALDLIARILMEPGNVVAVEDPGYPAAVAAFRAHGARHTIPVDDQGIRTILCRAKQSLSMSRPRINSRLGCAFTEPAPRAARLGSQSPTVIMEDD